MPAMDNSKLLSASDNNSGWFGHPRQLGRLFATEMWERFGFYGMRALLTLYLAQHFLFQDKVATPLYGSFMSLVYLTPLIGGMLADQYMGYKRAVKYGAILMALGYFLLCFGGEMARPYLKWGEQKHAVRTQIEYDTIADKQVKMTRRYVDANGETYLIYGQRDGSIKLVPTREGAQAIVLPADDYESDADREMFWVYVMFVALALIVVGNGFFKPNISTIVGTLYSPGDRRRDAGFTIFYMGINLGSFLAKILCPVAQVQFGFWAGFLMAAIGMLLSWCIIQFDGGRLKGFGDPPTASVRSSLWVVLGSIAAIPLIWLLLFNTLNTAAQAAESANAGTGFLNFIINLPLLGKILFSLVAVSVTGIPIWSFIAGTREEFQKMLVAIILIVFAVVFWTLFEQAGSSLTLFANRNTDLNVGGIYQMPAAQSQIFNPFFIVILAPFVTWFWAILERRGLEPSIPVKFSIGIILCGAGYLLLVQGAKDVDNQFRVALYWLVGTYLLHTIGELCLSPVGLSMITKLSMVRIVGLMMGVWFLSSSVAQYVGGLIAKATSTETVAGEVANPEASLAQYVTVFHQIGWWTVGCGVVLLIISPLLKRMMHGVK